MEQNVKSFSDRFMGKRYDVVFPFKEYIKMKSWFQHNDEKGIESEIWGKCIKKDRNIIIKEVCVPPQIAKSSSVSIDNEKLIEHDELIGCNMSIHSHVDMGVFFSNTDETNIEKWIKDIHDIFVYGVYSEHEYKVIVYDPKFLALYESNIHIQYDSDKFIEENKDKISEKTVANSVKYPYNDEIDEYNYWDDFHSYHKYNKSKDFKENIDEESKKNQDMYNCLDDIGIDLYNNEHLRDLSNTVDDLIDCVPIDHIFSVDSFFKVKSFENDLNNYLSLPKHDQRKKESIIRDSFEEMISNLYSHIYE